MSLDCSLLRTKLSDLKNIQRQFPAILERLNDALSKKTKENRKEHNLAIRALWKEERSLRADFRKIRDEMREMLFVSEARAIEIMGSRKNVLGLEDVQFILGFKFNPKDIPPIQYSEEALKKSREIREKTKSEEYPNGIEEMLVLFVKYKDGSPITGEKLNTLIQKKYTEMGLGKFLNETDQSGKLKNDAWFKDKTFFKSLGLSFEWKLITKQCIPDSKNKRHHFEPGDDKQANDPYTHKETQEYAIEEYAKKIGVDRKNLKRPAPLEMLYATALHLTATERINGKGNGEWLLMDMCHWSDADASGGKFVAVGFTEPTGAHMYGEARDNRYGFIGVCLSRGA